jgi:NAD(P)-dependent dehydrogenase (short-subunit alcohol dehydrogenase family)
MSLKDVVAIVTGGNSGIGMAISVRPAEAGASIVDRLQDNPYGDGPMASAPSAAAPSPSANRFVGGGGLDRLVASLTFATTK